LDFSRTFNTFVQCLITSPNGVRVKVNFALADKLMTGIADP
jgi:hypothetical protein